MKLPLSPHDSAIFSSFLCFFLLRQEVQSTASSPGSNWLSINFAWLIICHPSLCRWLCFVALQMTFVKYYFERESVCSTLEVRGLMELQLPSNMEPKNTKYTLFLVYMFDNIHLNM